MAFCPAITREELLLAALDHIDNPRLNVRAEALKSINDILPDGVSLGAFVGELIRPAGKRPWWQLQAAWILGHRSAIGIMSWSSFKLCQRLSDQIEAPSSEDAETLSNLDQLYRALFGA